MKKEKETEHQQRLKLIDVNSGSVIYRKFNFACETLNDVCLEIAKSCNCRYAKLYDDFVMTFPT